VVKQSNILFKLFRSITLVNCIVLFLFIPDFSLAQKRLEIINAASLKFDESMGNGAKRLIGDVQFRHDNVLMYCDSAYFYNDNTLEAFNNVHIQQNDTVHLYGDYLKYNGNDKNAEITGNAIIDKKDTRLTSNSLFYNTSTGIGYYNSYGRITNKDNELVSVFGYMYTKTNDVYFKKNVVLTNRPEGAAKPEFVINTDTMRYNTSTKVTYFYGPTVIKNEENSIYCEDGWYDTERELSRFTKHSYILTPNQKMLGDTLIYDGKKNTARAFNNIQIIDTAQKTTIKGDYAIHYESADLSIVTGNALLIKQLEKDTLYLHADTLKAKGGDGIKTVKSKSSTSKTKSSKSEKKDTVNSSQKHVYAYHHVKFYKKDLQGKCDSMSYSASDSLMRMFGAPVFWSDANQLTADSATIKAGESGIQSLYLVGNSFIVSQNDSLHYNQIRGKTMQGFFKNDTLYFIKVKGNGQTIYYVKEKEELKAANRADCSNMNIYLGDEKIKRIVFITKPDATLFPMEQINPAEMKLKGFVWRYKERPLRPDDILK
jgi:lipopolysaccharide export system protein LptA